MKEIKQKKNWRSRVWLMITLQKNTIRWKKLATIVLGAIAVVFHHSCLLAFAWRRIVLCFFDPKQLLRAISDVVTLKNDHQSWIETDLKLHSLKVEILELFIYHRARFIVRFEFKIAINNRTNFHMILKFLFFYSFWKMQLSTSGLTFLRYINPQNIKQFVTSFRWVV